MILSPRFQEAFAFAAQLHADQARKISGTPYLAHLMAVAALALEHGANETEAIAALLHDAIEDQGGEATGQEIGRRFGPEVLAIVAGCTDTDQAPKPPWHERKRAFIARLPEASPSVQLVLAADKLHNVRALLVDYRAQGEAIWSHFRGGREGTLWYYRAAAEALGAGAPAALVAELDRAVAEIERLAAAERSGQ